MASTSPFSRTTPLSHNAPVTAPMQVRGIVAFAVKQRELLIKMGRSRMDVTVARNLMRPLEQWLLDHPVYVSAEQVKRMWEKYAHNIRTVMPSTAAGTQRLQRLETILFSL